MFRTIIQFAIALTLFTFSLSAQETKKIKEYKTLTPEDKAQYNLY